MRLGLPAALRILAWLVFLLPPLVRGDDVLILLDADAAGPHVDIHSYTFPTWLLWPPTDQTGANRLEAIASGIEWLGDPRDLRFVGEGNAFRSMNYDSMAKRGYLLARNKHLLGHRLDLVSPLSGKIDVNVLLLALGGEGPNVAPFEWKQAWPKGTLKVAAAKSWDDVAALEARTRGKALVLEYPPPEGMTWSRYWLLGGGWPSIQIPMSTRTPMPGLIRASEVLTLLLHPSDFRWRNQDVGTWGGANRWLAFGKEVSPWMLDVLGGLVLAAAMTATVVVMQEKESRWVAVFLRWVILVPACLVSSGNACRWFQLETWFVWTLMMAVLLPLLDRLLGRLVRQQHRFASAAWIGAVAMMLCDPLWSVFGSTDTSASLATGALAAYLAIVVAYGSAWMLLTVGLVGAGIVYLEPWWVDPIVLLGLAGAIIGALQSFRAWMAAAGFFIAVPWLAVKGIAWLPDDLVRSASDIGRVNGFQYARFLLSPMVVAFACVSLFASLFGERFFWRQMRFLLRQDPRRGALLRAGVLVLILGLGWPDLLTAGAVVLIGGLLTLLYDGVRTL